MSKKSPLGIIISCALFLITCDKQTLKINSNIENGVSIKDGRYVFSNRDVFEKYVLSLGEMSDEQLDSLEKSLNFKSIRQIQNTSNIVLQSNPKSGLKTQSANLDGSFNTGLEVVEDYIIEDEAFASVLNANYIMQIDDIIFKVNVVDGYVYVMDVTNNAYLPQLEDAILEPNLIYRYDMGIPVLDVLDEVGIGGDPIAVDPYFGVLKDMSAGTVTPTPVCEKASDFQNGKCNGCAPGGKRKVQRDSVYYKKIINNTEVDKNRWESKIVYQPAGVWFSLVAKLEHRTNAPFTSGETEDPGSYKGSVKADSKTNIKMYHYSSYNFRKRCKNRSVGVNNAGNGYSSDEKKEYRFYSGTRCLKDYCVVSKFGIYEYIGRYPSGPQYKNKPTEWILALDSSK